MALGWRLGPCRAQMQAKHSRPCYFSRPPRESMALLGAAWALHCCSSLVQYESTCDVNSRVGACLLNRKVPRGANFGNKIGGLATRNSGIRMPTKYKTA